MSDKKTVLVDVDGVLAEYDGWKGLDHIGDPIPGARGFLEHMSEDYEVVIYSTRANAVLNANELTLRERVTAPDSVVHKLKQWLDRHNLPYDRIETGKPLAVAIIDDRAIPCRPQDAANTVDEYDNRLEDIDCITQSP